MALGQNDDDVQLQLDYLLNKQTAMTKQNSPELSDNHNDEDKDSEEESVTPFKDDFKTIEKRVPST